MCACVRPITAQNTVRHCVLGCDCCVCLARTRARGGHTHNTYVGAWFSPYKYVLACAQPFSPKIGQIVLLNSSVRPPDEERVMRPSLGFARF
mgnify:CR=1 FL=1